MNCNSVRLKAASLLPAVTHGFERPPYEEITRQQYEELTARLKPLDGELPHEEQLEDRYCEGGVCDVSI